MLDAAGESVSHPVRPYQEGAWPSAALTRCLPVFVAVLIGCAGGADEGDAEARACNGHPLLCERSLDQVAFPATHNGHAALDEGFTSLNANHQRGMEEQLKDGVRAILLDVYEEDGERVLCHGPCSLGRVSHVEALRMFVTFFEEYPDEVVILLYEDYAGVAALTEDFRESGAIDFGYTRAEGEPWPTLGALSDEGTPLLVTTSDPSPARPWLHGFYDIGFDTPYTYQSADEFSCDVFRGLPDHDLFLVNHWVNTTLNLPSVQNAKEVNRAEVLDARVRECEVSYGRIPNLVAVDFYEEGDLLEVVWGLNGLP